MLPHLSDGFPTLPLNIPTAASIMEPLEDGSNCYNIVGCDGGGGGIEALGSENAEKVNLKWVSRATEETGGQIIFGGNREEVDNCLQAVDQIQKSMASTSLFDDVKSTAMQMALTRLESEFRQILLTYNSPIEHYPLLASSSPFSFSTTYYSAINGSGGWTEGDAFSARTANDFFEEGYVLYEEGGGSGDDDGSADPVRHIRYRVAFTSHAIDLVPPEAVEDIQSAAKRMISAGYLRECIQAYGSVRRAAVDASYQRTGIEKLSIGDIWALEWGTFEAKITRCTSCLRILFASEKRLCELIFDWISAAIGYSCFMETIKGPATQLFSFAEAMLLDSRPPEKLFVILGLHDTLLNLLPVDVEIAFESDDSIQVQAAKLLSRLAEAAKRIITEFENTVLHELPWVPVSGETIHPSTRYVMNFISLISEYKRTLIELTMSRPTTGSRYSCHPRIPDMELAEVEAKSFLGAQLLSIIRVLQSNLEGMSKRYKDASLAHLFMTNNIHHIVQKFEAFPEMGEMIEDNYLRELQEKFKQAATYYERATWLSVLYYLKEDGLDFSDRFSSEVARTALRERFRSFNTLFEEVHRTQATWLVPDARLRKELQLSISGRLVPAYRSFLRQFKSHLESGKHPHKYIKYSVEGIERAISDFFEGRPVSQNPNSRSQ